VNARGEEGTATPPESPHQSAGALLPRSRSGRRVAAQPAPPEAPPPSPEAAIDDATALRPRDVNEAVQADDGVAARPEPDIFAGLDLSFERERDVPPAEHIAARHAPLGPAPATDGQQLCQLDNSGLVASVYTDPRAARHAPAGADEGVPYPAPSYTPPPFTGVPYEEAATDGPPVPPPEPTPQPAPSPPRRPIDRTVTGTPAPKAPLRPAGQNPVRHTEAAPPPSTASEKALTGAPIGFAAPAPHPVSVPPIRTPPTRIEATPLVVPLSWGSRPDELVVKSSARQGRLGGLLSNLSWRSTALVLLALGLAGGGAGALVASASHGPAAAVATTTTAHVTVTTAVPVAVHGPRSGTCGQTAGHGKTSGGKPSTTTTTTTHTATTTASGSCSARGAS
jgi:hypothetical protein